MLVPIVGACAVCWLIMGVCGWITNCSSNSDAVFGSWGAAVMYDLAFNFSAALLITGAVSFQYATVKFYYSFTEKTNLNEWAWILHQSGCVYLFFITIILKIFSWVYNLDYFKFYLQFFFAFVLCAAGVAGLYYLGSIWIAMREIILDAKESFGRNSGQNSSKLHSSGDSDHQTLSSPDNKALSALQTRVDLLETRQRDFAIVSLLYLACTFAAGIYLFVSSISALFEIEKFDTPFYPYVLGDFLSANNLLVIFITPLGPFYLYFFPFVPKSPT